MADLIFTYLTVISTEVLVPLIFLRLVFDIFRTFVFDVGGKY